MKRLVEETACVHGYFRGCTFTTDVGLDCPGGTSRELTVDYEAGAIEWIRVYETWPNEPISLEFAQRIARGMKQGDAAEGWTDDQYWQEHIDCVTAALDAALGGGR